MYIRQSEIKLKTLIITIFIALKAISGTSAPNKGLVFVLAKISAKQSQVEIINDSTVKLISFGHKVPKSTELNPIYIIPLNGNFLSLSNKTIKKNILENTNYKRLKISIFREGRGSKLVESTNIPSTISKVFLLKSQKQLQSRKLTIKNMGGLLIESSLLLKNLKIEIEPGGFLLIRNNANVQFDNINISGGSNTFFDGIHMSSAINIYAAKLKISNSSFANNTSEDLINVKNGELNILNSSFQSIYSDGIDFDRSKGMIKDSSFSQINGDALDFYYSNFTVDNVIISKAKDSGISAGERSIGKVLSASIVKSNKGIKVKDQSVLQIDKLVVKENKIDVDLYLKKKLWEFGGEIHLKNCTSYKVRKDKHSELRCL